MLQNNTGGTIHVKFKFPIESIFYIISATNQEQNSNAIDGKLRLIKGRIYYIPIDIKDINSDDYNLLKVFSDISDKLEVKFVKEGYACIIPIIHGYQIKDGQQLCVINN
jgi:hypothetical protein